MRESWRMSFSVSFAMAAQGSFRGDPGARSHGPLARNVRRFAARRWRVARRPGRARGARRPRLPAMVVTQGRAPVPQTVARLQAPLAARGLTLFAKVDHAAAARAAGLELPDEVVLLLGDARVGTGLMQ